MDREAVARSRRRRQVDEALEEERGREEALTKQLEEVVADEDGGRIDELAFARMEADVVLVAESSSRRRCSTRARTTPSRFALEDDALGEDGVDEEIGQLQAEIADSRRRQLAYHRVPRGARRLRRDPSPDVATEVAPLRARRGGAQAPEGAGRRRRCVADLEDGTAPDEKEAARAIVEALFTGQAGSAQSVR